MQEHLRNAFRKGHDAHRRHRCKLSPDDLARYGSAISGSQGRRPHAGPPQIWYPTPSHPTSSVVRAHAGELGHAVLHQEVVTTRVKGGVARRRGPGVGANWAPRQPSPWAPSSVEWRTRTAAPAMGKPDPERAGWALAADVLSSRQGPGEAAMWNCSPARAMLKTSGSRWEGR